MVIEEGFPGQRLFVLPRPVVQNALAERGTKHLLVTDCGYFPRARAHGMSREEPIQQAVVIVCTAGAGWCTIDGLTHDVHAGEVVVIPPGVAHSYGSEQDNPWTLWWMHLDGRDLPELLLSSGALGSMPVRTLTDLYRAVALLEEIVQQMERDVSQMSLFAAAGAAWHFLAVLASSTETGSTRSSVIERSKTYLQSHIAEGASVAALAAMARLSPSHFATLFRAQVGLPVLQYQTQLRMARDRKSVV